MKFIVYLLGVCFLVAFTIIPIQLWSWLSFAIGICLMLFAIAYDDFYLEEEYEQVLFVDSKEIEAISQSVFDYFGDENVRDVIVYLKEDGQLSHYAITLSESFFGDKRLRDYEKNYFPYLEKIFYFRDAT